MGHAEPPLQPPEPGLRPVERHDLPVHQQVTLALGCQSCSYFRERRRDLVPVPAHQPHVGAAGEAEAALTVQLPLENPAGTGERVAGERGQFRLHPRGRPVAGNRLAPRVRIC